MRIIAGEFRGRRLLPPASDATRPITDRAKQSLFDILTAHLADAVVYDLFAGTGSMGLECLSRGAKQALFFERDRSAEARLRQNIQTLGVHARARSLPGEIFKLFSAAVSDWPRADLIFLDPPYRYVREQPDALLTLARRLADKHLADEGVVIFRHDIADVLSLPRLRAYDQRTYGGMAIELLRFSNEPDRSPIAPAG